MICEKNICVLVEHICDWRAVKHVKHFFGLPKDLASSKVIANLMLYVRHWSQTSKNGIEN